MEEKELLEKRLEAIVEALFEARKKNEHLKYGLEKNSNVFMAEVTLKDDIKLSLPLVVPEVWHQSKGE